MSYVRPCRSCDGAVVLAASEAFEVDGGAWDLFCSDTCEREANQRVGTRYIEDSLREAFDVPARSRV